MDKVAIVFAGQGAQYTGMGMDLLERSEAARRIFDIAEQIRPGITDLCANGSAETLALTVNTQPAVFAVDLACAEAVREAGIVPDMVAGFSLGELAACTFARCFTPEDGMRLIMRRAALMDECARDNAGAMAAILKLPDEKVIELASRYDSVWAVNFNCTGQVSVAGSPEQLNCFCSDVNQAGGRAVRLAVSGAFHSPFMEKATLGLHKALSEIKPSAPEIPVYGNHRAAPYENIEYELAMQASNPVRWSDTIKRMCNDGADTFIEVGPGKTLSGLIRRIAPSAEIYSVCNTVGLEELIKK